MVTINNLDRGSIDRALALLGERMEQTAIPPITILVCGGASLEMEMAARWVMQQDPSEGFRLVLKDMLRKIGYEQASERL